MSNEDPNNASHWRNKLDKLEHLPGSSFNSSVAWDKLHGRLRGNKKSKRIFWYWMAAACVLFGLVITLLNFHKESPESANRETAINKVNETNKSTLNVKEVDRSKNDNSTEIANDKVTSVPTKQIQRNRRTVSTLVATKVQSSDVVINYPEQEPIAKPLQIVNNSTIAAVPPKKKLNVVHINELGDPVPDMMGKIDRQYKMRLGNGEVYSNPSTVYKNTDFTILKTKL